MENREQSTDGKKKNLTETMGEEIWKGSDDWAFHMRYSPLRQSVFNWYDFNPESSLLELDAGFGALTGLFCERCKTVTSLVSAEEEAEILSKRYGQKQNLHLLRRTGQKIASKLQEKFDDTTETMGLNILLKSGEKYDYIVACNIIETAKDPVVFLKTCLELLKPEGTLLLTVENRFGLKYFCGAEDIYTTVPFDGINGYLNGSGRGKCLSRQETVSALAQAGISQYKFYYPVPDSRMPQMIFTDGYQKGLNTAERLIDYNYKDHAMLGIEHRIFCEMIDSGSLPFLANSFLIEATKEGTLSDIVYAVTTTDRGPEYGTVTAIRNVEKKIAPNSLHQGVGERIVTKRPLFRQGEENIRKLHANTWELAAKGIPVVKTELKKDRYGLVLRMPFQEEEGLTVVLKRLAQEDKEKFVEIFDQIYGYLMAASDLVSGQDAGEAANKTGNDGKNYKVLKKAYLDLAPCNCFYQMDSEGKPSLLFYDQEFSMEDCPAEFAMFRTLKYCYASAGSMEALVPLSSMYARYGIEGHMLAEFEAREEGFIRQVRNTDCYHRLFQWATPDYKDIYGRMKRFPKRLPLDEKTVSNGTEKKPYRIGYVPGVFDLFHTGHLNLLERCKTRCEYLVVGVLTDELVAFYKGHGTVIPYKDRARIIEALGIVDEVIPVDESNTDKLDAWEQLHYDCHFSGDDHQNHWNDIWEELKKRGSNMEFFSYTKGVSSTEIRKKIE